MAVSIVFLLILIPLIFGIPILVAVYVYRDANKRGMNAVLWMLIALLTPSLLGLIIYLLVRNNYSDLKCPNCDTPVEESYVVCPNCRTKLRPTCEVCSAPIQTTWKVCPHCGSPLPEYSRDIATPVHQKDKTLGKILIAILVIPVVLILLLIFLSTVPYRNGKHFGYSFSSVTSLSMTEFLGGKTEDELAMYNDWFETHASMVNDQPYHVFVSSTDPVNDVYECQYLIYIPGAGEDQDISYNTETKGFFNRQDYWVMDITCKAPAEEQHVFILEYEGTMEPPQNFLITYNGKEHKIEPDSHTNVPFLPEHPMKPEDFDFN